MQIVLSKFVESDLETIGDYIAQDNPTRAITFVGEIREKFQAIAKNPLAYRLRSELGDDARMAIVGRYVILFRIADESIRIERVLYGGRDLIAQFAEF